MTIDELKAEIKDQKMFLGCDEKRVDIRKITLAGLELALSNIERLEKLSEPITGEI